MFIRAYVFTCSKKSSLLPDTSLCTKCCLFLYSVANVELRAMHKSSQREKQMELLTQQTMRNAEAAAAAAYEQDIRRFHRPEDSAIPILSMRPTQAKDTVNPPNVMSNIGSTTSAAKTASTTAHSLGFGTYHPNFLAAQRLAKKSPNQHNSDFENARAMHAFGGSIIEGGKIGAAKGVGIISKQDNAKSGGHGTTTKASSKDSLKIRGDSHRIVKKKKKSEKNIDPAEARAIAQREAARARVQARTLGSLGMK